MFLILVSSSGWLWFQHMQSSLQEHFDKQTSLLQTTYQTVVNSFRLSTEVLYSESIARPEIINLFRMGVEAEDEEQRSLLRGKLYRRLYPTYERLSERNLRHFHFHQADGRSYLRFHYPEKFGDELYPFRPALREVKKQCKPVFGFEIGRFFSGFRYIFPLLKDEQFIGSVETSLSFQAIEQALSQAKPDTQFSLVLKKQRTDEAQSLIETNIYVPTQLSADYVYEDLGLYENDRPTPQQPLIQNLNKLLSLYPEVQQNIKETQAFARKVFYQNRDYLVVFLPVIDVGGQAAGYLITYRQDPDLTRIVQDFNGQLIATFLGLALLIWTMAHNARARDALKQNQILFSGIFNNAPVGIGLLNSDGKYLQANPLFLRMLGYSWEEIRHKRCTDINHPDYVEASIEAMHKIILGKLKYWNTDKRFVRKDGTYFWGNHWLSSLRDQNGRCMAVICIISDLTERKRSEAKLRQLSRVVEQSHNAITITDLDGNIEFVNPAFTRTSGYSKSEVIGQNPRMLKAGNNDPDFYRNIWKTLVRGETWTGEMHNRRKNGEYYWESSTLFPIKDEHGNPTHYVAIKEDITHRKEAELELQQKNAELVRLNQDKNEFLGIAAHDLKNPLSAIKGLAEEIQEDYAQMSAEEVIEDAGKIRNAAKRMFMLITNLLDVNAIESSKLNIHLEPCNPVKLIQQTLDDYQERARQKQIYLEFHHQAADMECVLDPEIFLQIMDNLISNAIKYSPTETITQVRLFRHVGHMRCEIEDQGPGFKKEELPKLFGKFARLSAKPTGNEHSTGLGLFIVKKMAEAMHGNVWCETEVGKGACFILEFPLEEHSQELH